MTKLHASYFTAIKLFSAIQNFEFQILLNTAIVKIYATTIPWRRLLQSKNFDLSVTLALATEVEHFL